MQLSAYLRTVLKLDSASCLGMAAILVPAASTLSPIHGVPSALLAGAGIGLIPIGLFMLWLGTRREAPSALVWLVIVGNFGWSAASLAVAFGLPGIAAVGTALVASQGLGVVLFALLEWRGLHLSANRSATV